MISSLPDAERLASLLMWTSLALAVSMAAAVVVERAMVALGGIGWRRIERRYGPLVRRALEGDEVALQTLVESPSRHRIAIARLLIEPLIDDRNPRRIARTHAIVDAMELVARADRYVRSWWWWRRAIALRALGLVQVRNRTAAIVAALDDRSADVRDAALDALADLHDPASPLAVVVRLHDASLARGRRVAALAAFGSDCEPFILDLSQFDRAHLVNYARALAICGTGRSRPALLRWTNDPRTEVRAAAFEALGHVGLDADTAARAIEALNRDADASVRAMAAFSLKGWEDGGNAAAHLAQHLDDVWPVAIRAARSLQSSPAGRLELEAHTLRPNIAGVLARQMLWQESAQC